MSIINKISTEVDKISKRKKWRALNKHNYTSIVRTNVIPIVSVGTGTYGKLDVHISNYDNKLKIGCYCSIADNVIFILSSEHPLNRISTYPFRKMTLNCGSDGKSKGDIVIDDDVWIGYGATIMSGIRIGQGAVIAAGAVVTKDIPPYAIVGGVPAKIIKYRFEPEMIKCLLKIDYSKLTKDEIKIHIDDLYNQLTEEKQFSWMPKKKL